MTAQPVMLGELTITVEIESKPANSNGLFGGMDLSAVAVIPAQEHELDGDADITPVYGGTRRGLEYVVIQSEGADLLQGNLERAEGAGFAAVRNFCSSRGSGWRMPNLAEAAGLVIHPVPARVRFYRQQDPAVEFDRYQTGGLSGIPANGDPAMDSPGLLEYRHSVPMFLNAPDPVAADDSGVVLPNVLADYIVLQNGEPRMASFEYLFKYTRAEADSLYAANFSTATDRDSGFIAAMFASIADRAFAAALEAEFQTQAAAATGPPYYLFYSLTDGSDYSAIRHDFLYTVLDSPQIAAAHSSETIETARSEIREGLAVYFHQWLHWNGGENIANLPHNNSPVLSSSTQNRLLVCVRPVDGENYAADVNPVDFFPVERITLARPAGAQPGTFYGTVTVRAREYADNGAHRPATGAQISVSVQGENILARVVRRLPGIAEVAFRPASAQTTLHSELVARLLVGNQQSQETSSFVHLVIANPPDVSVDECARPADHCVPHSLCTDTDTSVIGGVVCGECEPGFVASDEGYCESPVVRRPLPETVNIVGSALPEASYDDARAVCYSLGGLYSEKPEENLPSQFATYDEAPYKVHDFVNRMAAGLRAAYEADSLGMARSDLGNLEDRYQELRNIALYWLTNDSPTASEYVDSQPNSELDARTLLTYGNQGTNVRLSSDNPPRVLVLLNAAVDTLLNENLVPPFTVPVCVGLEEDEPGNEADLSTDEGMETLDAARDCALQGRKLAEGEQCAAESCEENEVLRGGRCEPETAPETLPETVPVSGDPVPDPEDTNQAREACVALGGSWITAGNNANTCVGLQQNQPDDPADPATPEGMETFQAARDCALQGKLLAQGEQCETTTCPEGELLQFGRCVPNNPPPPLPPSVPMTGMIEVENQNEVRQICESFGGNLITAGQQYPTCDNLGENNGEEIQCNVQEEACNQAFTTLRDCALQGRQLSSRVENGETVYFCSDQACESGEVLRNGQCVAENPPPIPDPVEVALSVQQQGGNDLSETGEPLNLYAPDGVALCEAAGGTVRDITQLNTNAPARVCINLQPNHNGETVCYSLRNPADRNDRESHFVDPAGLTAPDPTASRHLFNFPECGYRFNVCTPGSGELQTDYASGFDLPNIVQLGYLYNTAPRNFANPYVHSSNNWESETETRVRQVILNVFRGKENPFAADEPPGLADPFQLFSGGQQDAIGQCPRGETAGTAPNSCIPTDREFLLRRLVLDTFMLYYTGNDPTQGGAPYSRSEQPENFDEIVGFSLARARAETGYHYPCHQAAEPRPGGFQSDCAHRWREGVDPNYDYGRAMTLIAEQLNEYRRTVGDYDYGGADHDNNPLSACIEVQHAIDRVVEDGQGVLSTIKAAHGSKYFDEGHGAETQALVYSDHLLHQFIRQADPVFNPYVFNDIPPLEIVPLLTLTTDLRHYEVLEAQDGVVDEEPTLHQTDIQYRGMLSHPGGKRIPWESFIVRRLPGPDPRWEIATRPPVFNTGQAGGNRVIYLRSRVFNTSGSNEFLISESFVPALTVNGRLNTGGAGFTWTADSYSQSAAECARVANPEFPIADSILEFSVGSGRTQRINEVHECNRCSSLAGGGTCAKFDSTTDITGEIYARIGDEFFSIADLKTGGQDARIQSVPRENNGQCVPVQQALNAYPAAARDDIPTEITRDGVVYPVVYCPPPNRQARFVFSVKNTYWRDFPFCRDADNSLDYCPSQQDLEFDRAVHREAGNEPVTNPFRSYAQLPQSIKDFVDGMKAKVSVAIEAGTITDTVYHDATEELTKDMFLRLVQGRILPHEKFAQNEGRWNYIIIADNRQPANDQFGGRSIAEQILAREVRNGLENHPSSYEAEFFALQVRTITVEVNLRTQNVDFLPADHIPRNSKGEIQPGIAPVGYGAHLNPVTARQHPDAGGAEIEFQIPQYPVAAWTAPKGFEYRFGKLPRGVAATVVPAEIFYGATRAVPAALRDSADESRQNPFYPNTQLEIANYPSAAGPVTLTWSPNRETPDHSGMVVALYRTSPLPAGASEDPVVRVRVVSWHPGEYYAEVGVISLTLTMRAKPAPAIIRGEDLELNLNRLTVAYAISATAHPKRLSVTSSTIGADGKTTITAPDTSRLRARGPVVADLAPALARFSPASQTSPHRIFRYIGARTASGADAGDIFIQNGEAVALRIPPDISAPEVPAYWRRGQERVNERLRGVYRIIGEYIDPLNFLGPLTVSARVELLPWNGATEPLTVHYPAETIDQLAVNLRAQTASSLTLAARVSRDPWPEYDIYAALNITVPDIIERFYAARTAAERIRTAAAQNAIPPSMNILGDQVDLLNWTRNYDDPGVPGPQGNYRNNLSALSAAETAVAFWLIDYIAGPDLNGDLHAAILWDLALDGEDDETWLASYWPHERRVNSAINDRLPSILALLTVGLQAAGAGAAPEFNFASAAENSCVSRCPENQIFANGQCQSCPDGQIEHRGACLPDDGCPDGQSKPNNPRNGNANDDRCTADNLLEFSEWCIANGGGLGTNDRHRCAFATASVVSSIGGCVAPAGPSTFGNFCEAAGTACTGGKTFSPASHSCECPDGMADDNGTCRSECPNGEVAQNGQCVSECAPEYRTHEESLADQADVLSGQICARNDCAENQIPAVNGTCQTCPNGQTNIGGECAPIPRECPEGETAIQGTTTCTDNADLEFHDWCAEVGGAIRTSGPDRGKCIASSCGPYTQTGFVPGQGLGCQFDQSACAAGESYSTSRHECVRDCPNGQTELHGTCAPLCSDLRDQLKLEINAQVVAASGYNGVLYTYDPNADSEHPTDYRASIPDSYIPRAQTLPDGRTIRIAPLEMTPNIVWLEGENINIIPSNYDGDTPANQLTFGDFPVGENPGGDGILKITPATEADGVPYSAGIRSYGGQLYQMEITGAAGTRRGLLSFHGGWLETLGTTGDLAERRQAAMEACEGPARPLLGEGGLWECLQQNGFPAEPEVLDPLIQVMEIDGKLVFQAAEQLNYAYSTPLTGGGGAPFGRLQRRFTVNETDGGGNTRTRTITLEIYIMPGQAHSSGHFVEEDILPHYGATVAQLGKIGGRTENTYNPVAEQLKSFIPANPDETQISAQDGTFVPLPGTPEGFLNVEVRPGGRVLLREDNLEAGEYFARAGYQTPAVLGPVPFLIDFNVLRGEQSAINDLVAAAYAGDEALVLEELELGAPINGRDEARGETALHAAVRRFQNNIGTIESKIRMVWVLAENGAFPWSLNNDGLAPMHLAVQIAAEGASELAIAALATAPFAEPAPAPSEPSGITPATVTAYYVDIPDIFGSWPQIGGVDVIQGASGYVRLKLNEPKEFGSNIKFTTLEEWQQIKPGPSPTARLPARMRMGRNNRAGCPRSRRGPRRPNRPMHLHRNLRNRPRRNRRHRRRLPRLRPRKSPNGRRQNNPHANGPQPLAIRRRPGQARLGPRHCPPGPLCSGSKRPLPRRNPRPNRPMPFRPNRHPHRRRPRGKHRRLQLRNKPGRIRRHKPSRLRRPHRPPLGRHRIQRKLCPRPPRKRRKCQRPRQLRRLPRPLRRLRLEPGDCLPDNRPRPPRRGGKPQCGH